MAPADMLEIFIVGENSKRLPSPSHAPPSRLRVEQRAANQAEIADALNVLRQRDAAPGSRGRVGVPFRFL